MCSHSRVWGPHQQRRAPAFRISISTSISISINIRMCAALRITKPQGCQGIGQIIGVGPTQLPPGCPPPKLGENVWGTVPAATCPHPPHHPQPPSRPHHRRPPQPRRSPQLRWRSTTRRRSGASRPLCQPQMTATWGGFGSNRGWRMSYFTRGNMRIRTQHRRPPQHRRSPQLRWLSATRQRAGASRLWCRPRMTATWAAFDLRLAYELFHAWERVVRMFPRGKWGDRWPRFDHSLLVVRVTDFGAGLRGQPPG